MKMAVTAFVAACATAMFAIWPGAEIARSSYSAAVVPPTNAVHLTILNPYPNVQAGSLRPLEIEPFVEATLAKPEAPLAALTPGPAVAPVETFELPAPAPK